LRARGLIEGRDLRLSFENIPEFIPAKEAEARAKRLIALRPDILVVEANPILGTLLNVRDMPIVFYNLAGDPANGDSSKACVDRVAILRARRCSTFGSCPRSGSFSRS